MEEITELNKCIILSGFAIILKLLCLRFAKGLLGRNNEHLFARHPTSLSS